MKIDSQQDKTTSVIISNELAEIWAKFESELTILTTNSLAKGADLGLKKWHSFQQINAANFKKQAEILGEKIKQEVIGSLKGNTDSLLVSIKDEVVKYTKTKNPPIPKKKVLALVDRVNDFQERTVRATIKQAGVNYLFSAEQIYQTTKVAVANSKNLVKDSSLRLVDNNPLLVKSIEKYSLDSAFRGQRVRYASGRSVSMRSYIEMNVRTELSNRANEMILSTCRNLGGTLFLVSEHANCAEDHLDIQGKVCTCNQEKFCGRGFLNLDEVRQKLQRPNCRHYLVPISEDQLLDLNKTKKELGTIKDNGLKGNYEDLKQQRYNERAIRHYKTERDNYLALASQMKDENIKNKFLEKAKNADLRVKKWQKNQRELVDKNDSLIRDYDRENAKNLRYNLGAKANDLTNDSKIGYNEEKDIIAKVDNLFTEFTDFKDNRQKIIDDLKNAPHKDVVQLFTKYADKMKYVQIPTSKSKEMEYYSPLHKTINLHNLARSYNSDDYAYQAPGQVIWHETGHFIDNHIAMELGYGEFSDISTLFESAKYTTIVHPVSHGVVTEEIGGYTLDMMLKEEWNLLVEKKEREIKERYRKWGIESIDLRRDVYAELQSDILEDSKKGQPLNKTFPNRTGILVRTDLSDIISGLSMNRVELGPGHRDPYWKTHQVSTEAFAELYSARMNNEQSYNFVKKYFPKSVDIFEEIIESVLKEGE